MCTCPPPQTTSPGLRPSGRPRAAPHPPGVQPEYKLAVVTEYENVPNGEKGAILRREGLYSSHVIEWTRARDAGVLVGERADPAAPSKRSTESAEQIELEKLSRRNAKLEADLTKTRLALDITGKAHALLEELSEGADNNEPPTTS
ncbi:MAG TPA: hypothetical protein VM347_32640 [Nonomuraea sp.]|nr:hypothetical protein [Nonomuraea sp.]